MFWLSAIGTKPDERQEVAIANQSTTTGNRSGQPEREKMEQRQYQPNNLKAKQLTTLWQSSQEFKAKYS
jgi:hypothetical protein